MAQFEVDSEVLEFAIHREEESHNFYRALAEHMENPQMRKILQELAEEESKHKAKLELELMKNGIVVDTQQPNNPFDASKYVVSNADTIDMDYKDLLEVCIQKEDVSYRLYADLLPQARDQSSKETLLGIMEEEIKHKLRFEHEYNKLCNID